MVQELLVRRAMIYWYSCAFPIFAKEVCLLVAKKMNYSKLSKMTMCF